MSLIKQVMVVGFVAALGGCATLTDSSQQLLEIHAVQDNREIAGVGCVLSNDVGRWFVVAPGRVTIERSAGPLAIDCAREGAGRTQEVVESRFDTGKLMGNVVVSAGVGYFVDRHSGAGFAYPATLTVLMQGPPARQSELAGQVNSAIF